MSDVQLAAVALEVLTFRTQVTDSPQPQVEGSSVSILSARGLEVLQLVARGLTSKAIGQHLFLSTRTVNHHLSSVFNKFGVDSRAHAVAVAAREGLV
jgi:two-component system, NarL family, response regulator YdfI